MNVFCTWCHAAVVRVFARAKVVMQVFFIRTIYFVMSPPLPLIQVGIPSFTFAKAPFMQMIYSIYIYCRNHFYDHFTFQADLILGLTLFPVRYDVLLQTCYVL